jgi:hypothetical protein
LIWTWAAFVEVLRGWEPHTLHGFLERRLVAMVVAGRGGHVGMPGLALGQGQVVAGREEMEGHMSAHAARVTN